MPGIVSLVELISNQVMAVRATLNLPPLTDGAIVIGAVFNNENSAPPRVAFIPRVSTFGPRSNSNMSQPRSATNPLAPGAGIVRYTYVTSGSGYSATPTVTVGAPDIAGGTQATAVAVVKNGALVTVVPTANGSGYLNVPTVTLTDTTGTGAAATAVLGPTPDQLAILGQRAVLTENLQFEVHCWGVGGTSSAISSDPTTDFDATQTLYQQVIVATHLNCAGVYRVAPGKWADALPGATTMNVFGHEFVFGLEFQTPVLDFPLVQAPVNVQPLATLTSDGEAP